MSRKDDPVFNVKFVQLVESHPCLWNSTLPAYSKKDEVQKAWQEVANETKDTLRNCRERWRTIRSSFLRSLKLARTNTGRGKRKYYLSKYLQFLIPYTKTRLKNGGGFTVLRKYSLPLSEQAPSLTSTPLNRIQPTHRSINDDDTKDSNTTTSEVAIAEEDVVVSLHEEAQMQRFSAIKTERDDAISPLERCRGHYNGKGVAGTMAAPLCSLHNLNSAHTIPHNNNNSSNNNNNSSSSSSNPNHSTNGLSATLPPLAPLQQQQQQQPPTQSARSSSAVDLTEFAEWIKSKNDHQRHCLMSQPDADQSFLNSLHPFLREMTGKQNRRFRQKVIGLIDAILENAD